MIRAMHFHKIVALAMLVGGCAYDPAVDVRCDSEGATQAGRTCRNGVWVAGDGLADGGPNVITSDAGMNVAPNNDVGPSDAADAACVPETVDELCQAQGYTCGEPVVQDRCGDDRNIICGDCSGSQECGDGQDAFTCVCPGTSNEEFCAQYQKTCGQFTAMDTCGDAAVRTVPSCGECPNLETCGADNTCTCDIGAACLSLGFECGMADTTDMCAGTDSILCGDCDSFGPASCVANQCVCDDGYTRNGAVCDDDDECAAPTSPCHVNADCTNEPGSYSCACKPGFVGDGVTACDSDATVTTQVVEIAMPDSDSFEASSITAVDASQSVPFMTTRLTDNGDQGNRIAVDVWLSADDEVSIERDNDNGDVDTSIYIAEFSPTFATVQSGTFSFSDASHSESINAINRDESFLIFYFQRSGGDAGRDTLFVAGEINGSGDAVDFERSTSSSGGTVSGHWWVVSAVNGSFAVQHAEGSMSGGTPALNQTISQIAPLETFVLYSFTSDFGDSDPDRTQISCGVNDLTHIRCTRASSSDAIPRILLQVVSVPTAQVFHSVVPVNADAETVSVPLLQTADLTRALAFGGALGVAGVVRHETSSGTQTPGGFFTQVLDATGDNVVIERGSPRNNQATVAVQVIDW